jgi:hypothetical protein
MKHQCLPSQHGFINKGYFKGRICEIMCVYNNRCTVLVGTNTFVIPMEFIIFYDIDKDQIIENEIEKVVNARVMENLTEDLSSVSITQPLPLAYVNPKKRKLSVIFDDIPIDIPGVPGIPEQSTSDIVTKKFAYMNVND